MTGRDVASRGQSLADLFVKDADAAILRILQEADGKALNAGGVKAVLISAGIEKAAADKAWKSIQAKRLKSHDQVAIDPGNRYRWTTTKPEMTASDALNILAKAGGTAARRAELVGIVRRALDDRGDQTSDLEWGARVRTTENEGIRLLADLASMVEGLIDNETPPDAMVRMVRTRVSRSALEAVGHAGEQTTFDRTAHEPISSAIRDGATVFVVRPGYVWKKADKDVLVLKAVVEE